MFADKAGAFPNDVPFRRSTLGYAKGLSGKIVNYGCKKFYGTGPR